MKNIVSYTETWILPHWTSEVHVVVREYDDGHWAYNLARRKSKDDIRWCHKSFIGATEEKISEVIRQQARMDELMAEGSSVLEVLEAIFG